MQSWKRKIYQLHNIGVKFEELTLGMANMRTHLANLPKCLRDLMQASAISS